MGHYDLVIMINNQGCKVFFFLVTLVSIGDMHGSSLTHAEIVTREQRGVKRDSKENQTERRDGSRG